MPQEKKKQKKKNKENKQTNKQDTFHILSRPLPLTSNLHSLHLIACASKRIFHGFSGALNTRG